ncbi:hypothetical protein [Streptomyces sp. NPDC088350]|uniref:hypothetical protein n=1 Tax=Streptomyces sp. NPDC088350 TaxID=3365854 RepID=UPI0038122706
MASVVGYSAIQLTAVLALIALVLQVLFEIDEKISARKTPTWYPTFQRALPHISEEIEMRLRRGKKVKIRWIGVTHEAGWPFSQNILLSMLGGRLGEKGALSVELALLDPDGDICQRPNSPDRDQIRSTKEKISRFGSSQAAELAEHDSSLALYLYDHRPTWHALLVDEDTLFYSTCMPSNLEFASPQGGVEVISVDSGEHNAERVQHFVAWFDVIESEARSSGKYAESPVT